jgi:cardiolipin synthase
VRAMFGWIRRNHRKSLIVDGTVAFIGGLCLGEQWEGTRDVPPWRDTALELRGPAVAQVERVFATSWTYAGGAALWPADHHPPPGPSVGTVDVRLVVTEPFTANLFRLDLLVAAMARKRLWISDAYFIGHGPFADALCQAAQDGVDVRLLLPQSSDVGWTVPVARSVYRSLLAGGVRVYEWTGSMMHAKTAVADSMWSRIGSTNLNVNSWLGNWELDVAIEDAGVAGTLEAHFEDDLHHATEITWSEGRLLATPTPARRRRPGQATRRVAREVSGVARSVGAALTGSRPIEGFEVGTLVLLATLGAAITAAALWQPMLVVWPVVVFCTWAAITLLVDAWVAWRHR